MGGQAKVGGRRVSGHNHRTVYGCGLAMKGYQGYSLPLKPSEILFQGNVILQKTCHLFDISHIRLSR